MSLPYDPNPTAIEVRVMPSGGSGQPEFVWATIPVVQIMAVMPMRKGDGCTLSLVAGETLLCSNAYRDVSDALVGDAKRFDNIPEVEELILGQVEVVDQSEVEDDEDEDYDEAFLRELSEGGDQDFVDGFDTNPGGAE